MRGLLLHGEAATFGWHDWPWVAALALVVGVFWLALRWLQRRTRAKPPT